MRILRLAALAAVLLAPGIARAAISCADLPQAEAYVHDHLRPGPNTRLAERHLEAARHARSERACRSELGKVNYYAKRSLAADRRASR
jgi:predicted outer membrane protein